MASFSPNKEKQIYAATNEAHGKPKVFRDSAISNLTEFFDRFQRLNIQSDEDLDQLVESARQVISGVSPQDLRDRHAGRPSENGF